MRLRPRSVTLLAALIAATFTNLVVMVPGLHYAYRSVPLHAMLETTATIIALLTTVLLWGRLRERQRLDDLLLFVALALLTTTNLLFAAIPAAIWTDPHPFSIWTTVCGGAASAALLAAAAFAPPIRLRDYEKAARIAITLMALGLVAIGTVIGAVRRPVARRARSGAKPNCRGTVHGQRSHRRGGDRHRRSLPRRRDRFHATRRAFGRRVPAVARRERDGGSVRARELLHLSLSVLGMGVHRRCSPPRLARTALHRRGTGDPALSTGIRPVACAGRAAPNRSRSSRWSCAGAGLHGHDDPQDGRCTLRRPRVDPAGVGGRTCSRRISSWDCLTDSAKQSAV